MESLPRRLERLEDGLAALPRDYDAMTLGEIDGFIAAIILCPVAIDPEEWLGHLWRSTDSTETVDPALLEDLRAKILDHFKLTALGLKAAEEGYAPIVYIEDESGDTVWESWAGGFGEGMQLRMESWDAVRGTGDAEALAALDGLKELVRIAAMDSPPPAQLGGLVAKAADLIPDWVEILYDWRLAYRPEPVQLPVRSEKIGRNDPCPCGSGRKYKKCCGVAG
ncbi:hypothetical protein Sa4125_37690 [Aureimonas sp. SA4125]|uniref:UPF0149 family protein n=1 Tax=Aureimonas sp. SA4125 TaxID=2826993 RepID=UPI001CC5A8F8|nr:UPF0149 family protein [Aureimonas sp. SA4125]BDA86227.1 hypothetical protein Sa4125_37690 [Aureimonas sp. SA4125]